MTDIKFWSGVRSPRSISCVAQLLVPDLFTAVGFSWQALSLIYMLENPQLSPKPQYSSLCRTAFLLKWIFYCLLPSKAGIQQKSVCEDKSLDTDCRLEVPGARVVRGQTEELLMGIRSFTWKWWKCFETRQIWWLKNIVNTLDAVDLFTSEWSLFCYVNFNSVLKKKTHLYYKRTRKTLLYILTQRKTFLLPSDMTVWSCR